MKLHSINADQKVYVMNCGRGFSCYGFAVLDKKKRVASGRGWRKTGKRSRRCKSVKARRDILRNAPGLSI